MSTKQINRIKKAKPIVRVKQLKKTWVAQFTIDHQTFNIEPLGARDEWDDEHQARWQAKMLRIAFKRLAN